MGSLTDANNTDANDNALAVIVDSSTGLKAGIETVQGKIAYWLIL